MGLSMFSPDFSFISSGRGPAAVVAAAPASGNATSHVQADRQNRGSRGSTCSGDLWEFRCPPKLGLTSGKLTVCELENHHFLWVIPLPMGDFLELCCLPEGTRWG